MKIINVKIIIGIIVLLSLAEITLAFNSFFRAVENMRSPDLPPPCSVLQVPEENKPSFHVYAIGVQIYRWNGAGWDFVAPEANLFADNNYRGKVGTHYGGPTWESNSGSNVVASRLSGCTPDASAVPWLLLQKVSTEGPGVLENTTYIQRVNTVGGLRPAISGSTVGEEARVPYTAEYYFYRAME